MPGKRSEYAEYIADVLAPLGPIRLRAMFGGYGIYCDELFFALIIDDTLYFKADAETRPRFEAEQLSPFVYETKAGKSQSLSYYQAPELIFEDIDELRLWGNLALGAALRARKLAKKPAAAKSAAKKPVTPVGKAGKSKSTTPITTAGRKPGTTKTVRKGS